VAEQPPANGAHNQPRHDLLVLLVIPTVVTVVGALSASTPPVLFARGSIGWAFGPWGFAAVVLVVVAPSPKAPSNRMTSRVLVVRGRGSRSRPKILAARRTTGICSPMPRTWRWNRTAGGPLTGPTGNIRRAGRVRGERQVKFPGWRCHKRDASPHYLCKPPRGGGPCLDPTTKARGGR